MSTTFSVMVKQIISEGSGQAMPNPAKSGYLCTPDEFLSELIRFVSMMQVLKVGVGNEVAAIKLDLKKADQSLNPERLTNSLYHKMIRAIHKIEDICTKQGEDAYMLGDMKLAETYGWTIAGCRLFLEHVQSNK